jgi:hypothetical protein
MQWFICISTFQDTDKNVTSTPRFKDSKTAKVIQCMYSRYLQIVIYYKFEHFIKLQ